MPKRTQNPSEIDELRARVDALAEQVRELADMAVLSSRTAPPEEPRTWRVSAAQPPRDWRPMFGDRPDDVKGASAPLTYGD